MKTLNNIIAALSVPVFMVSFALFVIVGSDSGWRCDPKGDMINIYGVHGYITQPVPCAHYGYIAMVAAILAVITISRYVYRLSK